MKFKKLIAASLTTMMAVSMFAGCGKKDDGVAADGTVTINITRACFNLTNGPDQAQLDKVEAAINDYLKEKGKKIQVNITEYSSGNYAEKVNAALMNQEINLLWTAAWEPTIGTNELKANDSVYDLTEIVKGTDLYNSMDAGQWDAAKYDGKTLFVPVYKDNVEGYDILARKAVADKYGWDLSKVKTLKDLEPMLEDCKKEGLKYPMLTQRTAMFFRYYINDFDFFMGDATMDWVAVDRNTDSVVNTIQTTQYKEFCTLMGEWGQKGYVHADDAQKATTDTTTQGQDWGLTWWTDVPVNAEASSRYKQEVVWTPITYRWAHSTSALGSCYCVTKNSSEAQAKACVEFLGLLYTDSKLADLYTFGIEGEDYKRDANGQVVQVEYVNGDPEQGVEWQSEKYNHSMWESANATIVTPLNTEPANKAELYKEFNGGANTSCAAGFRFNKQPVEAEVTACVDVFNEYGFGLENGSVAPADVEARIAEYQKKLDEAGYQKVLEEFQKQYDEWKKNK